MKADIIFFYTHLIVQIKQVGVFSGFGLGVRDEFPNIFTDKGTLGYVGQWAHTPAHAIGFENLQSNRNSMLNDSVVAAADVASTQIVAFKYHGRFLIIEAILQPPIQVVPGFHAQIRTVASVFCCAIVGTFTMLN